MTTKPKIVLAHDYLTQRGGAERVALEIARALSVDHIVTSAYSPGDTFSGFENFEVRTSFVDAIPTFRRDPRLALPFLPFAWGAMKPVDADLVICSSSGWSHAVPTTSKTKKVVYCHNPARWIYQRGDYLLDQHSIVVAGLTAVSPVLGLWDRAAAKTAAAYMANSTSVAGRIKDAYGIDATVVFPPVCVELSGDQEVVPGLPSRFFVTAGRGRAYKGTELLARAFEGLEGETLVVVGARAGNASEATNVKYLGFVSDAQLRWLYSHSRALISVSKEDFGLTPIEANSFGSPSLLLRAGGFLDSTAEGVSGKFIEAVDVESIREAVRSFPEIWDRAEIKRHAEQFSISQFVKRIRLISGLDAE